MDRYSYVRQITIENNSLMLHGIELMNEMVEHTKIAMLVLSVEHKAFNIRSRALAAVNLCLFLDVQINLGVLHNRQKTIREMAVHNGYYDALHLEGIM